METWIAETTEKATAFIAPLLNINPIWFLVQAGVVFAAWIIAAGLSRTITPHFEAQIREIRGNPRLLRLLALLLRRLKWVLFAVVLWLAVFVMREMTWPSRSYFVAVAANLATAWAVISIVTRTIRIRSIANLVAVFAWAVAALSILGMLDQTIELLDSTGIQFDDFKLTPLLIIKAVVVVSTLVWVALVVGRFADQRIHQVEDLSPSLQVLIGKLTRALLLIAAILAGFSMVGVDFTALAVFSGAIGLGIGFGLQKVVSNLISGIILLVDKSIKPGDVITVGDTYGRINQLAARYASVISRDGREYLIPNEDLITSQVVNWSYSSDLVRLDLDFGVSYLASPHEVRKLARETAAGHQRVQAAPPPVCHITAFGDSSVDYRLRFWIRDPDNGTVNVRGDIFLMLWDALQEAGIEIPYPHRDLAMRGPVKVEIQDPSTSQ